MKKGILLLTGLFWVFLLRAQNDFTLCEMNVENLFDCQHQQGHDDETFLPESGRRWTPVRYRKKLELLSKVLISMSRKGPPDVIALEEVENDSVMSDLTRRAILRRAGYRYTMTVRGDERGMNVALIYQPEKFKLLSSESISPTDTSGTPLKTRQLLHVTGRLTTGEILHVFVCHFSSRIGGSEALRYRQLEGTTLRKAVQQIMHDAADAKVIVVGDFNEGPTSDVLRESIGFQDETTVNKPLPTVLYNLSGEKTAADGSVRGTYKYDSHWEMIDQCLVNGNLLQPTKGLHLSPDAVEIWAPSFILETDPQDLGLRPRRTYEAYRYHGGASDHLPLRITLKYAL